VWVLHSVLELVFWMGLQNIIKTKLSLILTFTLYCGHNSCIEIPIEIKLKKNSIGLSPRANYTDRTTAACQRSDCQLFCGYRVPRGQLDGSLLPYSPFSRQEPLLFYQVAPQLYSRDWVDPVPDPLLFFLAVPGIEPRPPDLQPRTLTARPQRRSQSTVCYPKMVLAY
jgi:hypothetical protein